uniref:patatin-like phospholipase family protein n=1 Tax=uncultured Erythrobacter sp. TaxID=263913 RepID=UPI00262D8057|nr:patatin-like phospholipase family protein [uncultured Erythrobacter sp.]
MAGGLGLALSGGGAHGAFQVGVLDELIERRGVDFETVVGTSTGAIQAAGVAQNDIARLLDLWTGIRGNDDIYRSRGGELWAVITGKDSMFSTGPLRELLHKTFDDAKIRATGKNLRLAVANLTNGQLRIVGENTDNIADWVYASAAQPPAFPPFRTVDENGQLEQWVDGGLRDVTPFRAALREKPRAILAVRAEGPKDVEPKEYKSLVKIGLRSVDLLTEEVADNDLGNVDLINNLLQAESKQRAELEALNLEPAQIAQVMEPLSSQIERYNFVPTMVLRPPTNLHKTLEFVPELIAENIERGRQIVRDNWDELGPFLGLVEAGSE